MARKKSLLVKVAIITLLLLLVIATIVHFHDVSEPGPMRVTEGLGRAGLNPASYANAVKKAAPAVVSIQTTNGETLKPSLGSGILLNKSGYILTNNHVIENTSEILIKLADGRSAAAQIIGTDPQTDLAVLRIQLPTLPESSLGTSSSLQVGDVVLAIGNPIGLNTTVTQGIVSAIGSIQATSDASQEFGELLDNLIQTDAAINLGNSGGALIDAYGNVIGINTAIISTVMGSQGIGFAIPIDTAKEISSQLITHGTITRGWIGAQLTAIPPETRQYLNYQDQDGIYVQDTLRNSPAQKAGILPGDIITKVNNIKTKDILATIRLITLLIPDKTYNLEIFRQGKIIVYPVMVATRS